jgi:hypothetical protein
LVSIRIGIDEQVVDLEIEHLRDASEERESRIVSTLRFHGFSQLAIDGVNSLWGGDDSFNRAVASEINSIDAANSSEHERGHVEVIGTVGWRISFAAKRLEYTESEESV